MAKIILEPNESFEHIHSDDSYTSLVKGKGALKMNGKIISMKAGEIIKVPAGVTHTVVNEGMALLTLKCVHPPLPPRRSAGK